MAKRTYRPKFVPYDEVLRSAERRIGVLPDEFYNKVPREMRPLAFTVSLIEKQSSIKAILDSLNQALAEGKSFNEWKETVQVDRFQRLADYRKELIFRTHMQTAYNQGSYQVAQELKRQVPYLRYSAVIDERTRTSHRAMDGIVRPVDDDFWKTHLPPNGFNCRCEVVSVGKGDELQDVGGLTTPKQLKKIRTEGVLVDGVKVKGKPDKGWEVDKLNETRAATNLLRKKNKLLPRVFRSKFLEKLFNRDAKTDVWWEKNKSLFAQDDE